eukprot:COSAG04_NODE_840_length_9955_cov_5.454038_10_plen_236_part_00
MVRRASSLREAVLSSSEQRCSAGCTRAKPTGSAERFDSIFFSLDSRRSGDDFLLVTEIRRTPQRLREECFTHPAWRFSEWQAAEAEAPQKVFAMFDADGDGKLSKDEYRAYLRGAGAWGKGPYTDKTWDKRWSKECKDLESSTDGISQEAFESILYGKYRLGEAQVYLDKCKEWAAMSETEQQSHQDKSCVRVFEMKKSTHLCDVCRSAIPRGANILRCERCDYDLCEKCKSGQR